MTPMAARFVRAAALYSLMASANLNGLELERYLHHVLSEIAVHPFHRSHNSSRLLGQTTSGAPAIFPCIHITPACCALGDSSEVSWLQEVFSGRTPCYSQHALTTRHQR